MRIWLNDTTHKPYFLEKRVYGKILDICATEVERKPPFNFDYIDFNMIDTTDIVNNDSIIYYGFPMLKRSQEDAAYFYQGNVTKIYKTYYTYMMEIGASHGCSGSPVFRVKNNNVLLKGVLFSHDDKTDKISLCQAIDIKCLVEMLGKD